MYKNMYKIMLFDDGRKKYKQYVNKWLLVETKFNGGKLVLKNAIEEKIIINSISSWKVKLIVPSSK